MPDNAADSDDGQELGGSIYQKIDPKLESGVQLAWSPSNNNTKFGVAVKYEMDKDCIVRAKINNAILIGLGYQQRLRAGKRLLFTT
ncbi:hypothetical protein NQ314_016977 [Rhamnusium bicolor]|uniref:Uncharacterized protein n=1 Tax=Rhamnusium bicolor TaxID=1586634 RepID=A0AAV8WU13_9CUCU|nr:hypothetical protein NQ314_016977 [Rhamnusium bicolor]